MSLNPAIRKILDHKRDEVLHASRIVPEDALLEAAAQLGERRSLTAALAPHDGKPRVIAEIKRSTPSAMLKPVGFDPVRIANSYEAAGAAALSVLTEDRFFCGSPLYVPMVRETVSMPVLRKDFVVDRWQIAEAAALGADAVLLMAVNIEDDGEFAALFDYALKLGLEPLVEVHSREEWERIKPIGPKLVGINNRDFTSQDLKVDIAATLELAPMIPPDVTVVSESGIGSPDDIREVMKAGVRNFLIGTAFMKTPDAGAALARLLSQV